MPAYDCGAFDCEECHRAFGPDRAKAIENYRRREAFYASLPEPPTPRTLRPQAGERE